MNFDGDKAYYSAKNIYDTYSKGSEQQLDGFMYFLNTKGYVIEAMQEEPPDFYTIAGGNRGWTRDKDQQDYADELERLYGIYKDSQG